MIEIPGYTLLRPLGRGGMGEVHLAVQHSLGREVALKLLAPALAQDEAARDRFVREARIAANLHHPHIVPIYEVGVHDGSAYIAMEYEPGGTVSAIAQQGVEPSAALRIVRDVADALDYAHELGVVHRDVKPDNILRREKGLCLLSDFGIAHAVEAKTILTHEGASVGTPQYMSPEQLRGQPVDGRSDLYSLGVVLYQLLTGQLPYSAGDSWALGMQHINDPIPRLPAELAHLQSLIDSLMAKDPNARPRSGAEVVTRIGALLAGATPALTRPIETLKTSAPMSRRRATWVMGATVVLLALGAMAIWSPWRGHPSADAPDPGDKSIAVLPFVNMSSDKEQEYFSDGLSEELLNQLAQIPKLRVIARTSSFSFKGKEVDVATIARALNVAHVLEGSVRRSGQTLRITAQLIRAADSSHLWSQTYERELADVFKVQDEISRDVVSALKLQLLPGQMLGNTQRTRDPAAYEQYLLGVKLIATGGQSLLEASATAFERAIALAPDYANAYAELAFAQGSLADFAGNPVSREAMIQRAMASADKAIALAPDLPDAYAVRGNTRHRMRWDWQGAQADFEQALKLDANNSRTLANFGPLLFSIGRRQEGIALLRKATDADPLSANAWTALGRHLTADRQLAEAGKALQRAFEINPNQTWVNYLRGNLELSQGRADVAMVNFARAPDQYRLTGTAMVEFTRGNEAASKQALATLESRFAIGFAFQIAQVHAWRGEKDEAFAWLDRAYDVHDTGLVRLPYDPGLDPLRADPRFAALVQKVGFPK